jgi:GDP-4-dehydro-6-deoxy-D-mannose reductase
VTVLLLGARGFAGSHFSAAARDAGLDLVTASRDGGQTDLVCDLLDPASLGRALAEAQPSAVVNMAGQASVRESWSKPRDTFEVNATGVLNLLDALASAGSDAYLLCLSSAEVYGTTDPAMMPLTEDAPVHPLSPYGSSKAAMELLADQYSRSRGVRAGIARAFNQIGPGQSAEFVASSLGRQIAEAERRGGDRLQVTVGNVSAARDFTDIRDSARGYVEMVDQGLTGTHNVCSGKALKIEELLELMRSHTPLAVEVTVDEALIRPSDPALVLGSADRLREATGWEPRIPIGQTVADILDWWRQRLDAAGPAIPGASGR